MKAIYSVLVVALLVGCSSSSKRTENGSPVKLEPTPDVVLSRIDNLSERPSWLKESDPFYFENGSLYSLGTATLKEDQRVESGGRIATINAKATISQAISQRLSVAFQHGEEGAGLDEAQTQYIAASASEITTSHLKPTKYYWEKISQVDSSGQSKIVYKVFSLVSLPESEFKAAIIKAAKQGETKAKVSTEFKDKLNRHWDKFVGQDEQKAE